MSSEMRDICSDWDQDVETLADSALEDLEETVSWFTGSALSNFLGQTLGVINLLTKTRTIQRCFIYCKTS